MSSGSSGILRDAQSLWAAGRQAEAEALCRGALERAPRDPDLVFTVADMLAATGRAADCLDLLQSIAATHAHEGAHARRLGAALLERGEFTAAVAALRQAARAEPANARVHNNLGQALLAQGSLEDAAASYRQATACDPGHAGAHSNLGRALHRLGRLEQARAALERAITLAPTLVPALVNLGGVLRSCGELARARSFYEQAVALNERVIEAWFGLADVARDLGDDSRARSGYQRVLALSPENPQALAQLGLLHAGHARFAEARELLGRALAREPSLPYLAGYALGARLSCADWADYDTQLAALACGIERGERVCTPFISLLVLSSPAAQRRCAEIYVGDTAAGAAADAPRRKSPRPERITIGYLSADFHEHAMAYLMAGLFEAHDRSRFDVHGLSIGTPVEDAMRRRVRRAFGHLEELHPLSDTECAARIATLGIDILIELNGHTARARPGILGHRPAPLQVSYLGFPGTVGAGYVDYLLADAHVIPPEDQHHYTEKVVYLPTCYQVNDHKGTTEATLVRGDCGLPEDAFVFCCFNNLQKLTPSMFTSWMRILMRAPHSLLWLLSSSTVAMENLRRHAALAGVNPTRLSFAPPAPHTLHLARYPLADLFLDTLPYNAHTTASDALWYRCPVITATGSTFAGRVGTSLLHAVGAPELIVATLDEYERLAVRLATDPEAYLAVKTRICARARASPLFDTDARRREIERAYEIIWDRHERGGAPAGFAVPANPH